MKALVKILLGGFVVFMGLAIAQEWTLFSSAWFGEPPTEASLTDDERKQAAEIIQQNLKTVGIDIKIKIVEWQAFINQFVDKRRFEAIILGWSIGIDPDN